jgi:hypothetical protein
MTGTFLRVRHRVIRRVAILHTDGTDTHRQEQAQRIDYQISFGPFTSLPAS